MKITMVNNCKQRYLLVSAGIMAKIKHYSQTVVLNKI